MDLKMEVYTPYLELVGILEVYRSVIWEEKAFGAGSFSVDSLITDESKTLLVPGNIIWIFDNYAGVIEYVQEQSGKNGPYITVKGPNLTGILGQRILWGQYNLAGTAPAIMHNLVSDCCISPTRGNTEARKIPGLVSLTPAAGGDAIRAQKTGSTLLEALEELGAAYGVAFGVRFNAEIPRMEFWTRWGQNRSVNQTTHDPVFYSTELDDVLSSEYSYNAQDYRNVALVAGEGEGGDRVTVTVNADVAPTPIPPTPVTKYIITLSVDPAGGGTATGGGQYQEGDTVTLTASPSSGYTFSGWRENGSIVSTNVSYTFTASADRSLTAVFAATVHTYTITASIDPAGSGTATGTGAYQQGASVTVTATPADGYKFVKWTENGQTVSESANYTFTVSGDRTLVAVFEEDKHSRLPAGYIEVEWISVGRNCQINTGIIPNLSTARVVYDMQTSDYGGYIFYTKKSSANRFFLLARNTTNTVTHRLNTANAVTNSFSFPASRTELDFDLSSGKLKIGASSFNLSRTNVSLGTNLYLFSGDTPNIVMKIYGIKIYSGNTLQRDFVPCKNSDENPGFYDLIDGGFYQNISGRTGIMTPGPAV